MIQLYLKILAQYARNDLQQGVVIEGIYWVVNIKAFGEEWRNLVGDNLILAMAYRIEELEETLNHIRACRMCSEDALKIDGYGLAKEFIVNAEQVLEDK